MHKKPDGQRCYIVSEETLAKTLKCNKDFSCLKAQTKDLYIVDSCINGEILFIRCLNKEGCVYQGTFGDGIICYCPTRKELYNKHGV